ncbi:MAG: aldehyde dehydrogenase (NADP(+)) [Terriglobales bacterium]
MELTGKNWIAGTRSAEGPEKFQATNPRSCEAMSPDFVEATPAEIDRAAESAAKAATEFGRCGAEQVADFLDGIAVELERVKDELVARAQAESGLPAQRLAGEHGRTTGQIRMFAQLVREGSWVDARIDTALPDRKPLPRPDLRRMLVAIGPVAVFGASNFPLAFSVAGGDTASALAAKNPVIVKAHPAHPGTSEIAASAIVEAAQKAGMPSGIFSMVHGVSPEVSLALVRHRAVKAVGFTGSQRAGRALFDAASKRDEPIPVYAEMGSVNPVFLLPGALAEREAAIARGLRDSVTLGVGQFCTCPGLAIGVEGPQLAGFANNLAALFREAPAGTMLHRGILAAYEQGLTRVSGVAGVSVVESGVAAARERTESRAALLQVSGNDFLQHPELAEEVFGPSTVLVRCTSPEQMAEIARELPGSLTATVQGTEQDMENYGELVAVLVERAGRVIFNGYPTGVEVSPAMQHGGPWPATTDAKYTSVGTAAILRFARPVCFQSFPQAALPPELRDGNPRKIWRLVNGEWSKD